MAVETPTEAPSIDEIIARVVACAEERRVTAPLERDKRVAWPELALRLRTGPSCAADFRRRLVEGADFKPNAQRLYSMGDFLRLHGPAFVHACYWGILGRAPDAQGFQGYLGQLMRGMRKEEIVARMRFSPEGRAHGATIRGLGPHAVAAALFRIPVAGYLIEWLLALAALPRAMRGLRALEAHDAQARERLAGEVERALRRLEGEISRDSR